MGNKNYFEICIYSKTKLAVALLKESWTKTVYVPGIASLGMGQGVTISPLEEATKDNCSPIISPFGEVTEIFTVWFTPKILISIIFPIL